MLSSPRSPARTIRIFSSAEYCLRVRRRMSRTVCSTPLDELIDFCLICVPFGHYDELAVLAELFAKHGLPVHIRSGNGAE